MTPELLDRLREKRNFDPEDYLAKKTTALQQFFAKQQLDSCVIGISGGIDSAITLALLARADLRKIVPLLMPIHGNGTTGQDKATQLAIKQCQELNLEPVIVDLTVAYKAYIAASADVGEKTAWANGQLASIVRTPCTYYHAALLQTQGYRSIVVGTINRDEGAYIGFFGKASDAMVDLQPIADLHKSEVYALAEHLDIIPDIKNRKPRGDVWDNKTDEEMIGAPYWAVEMHALLSDYMSLYEVSGMETVLPYMEAIESLHQTNRHKYRVGVPSHFVDVMPRKVANGW